MSEGGEATPRVYLAGPDIYHPRAEEIAANKKSICERYGLEGVTPMDIEGGRTHSGSADDGLEIYRAARIMIAGCDALIANMTPFRGPGIDAATALEMGVMAGYGRPIVGYSLDTQIYKDRLAHLFQEIEEDLIENGSGLATRDGLSVEDFGLLDTAVIAGAAMTAGAPIAEDFEAAVRWMRRLLRPA
ncbi:MAG: nucleoside 2-deoxyribosyltransferase [Rhodospirillaceae bacterium]|jgi:nucleoside 2-deoxyribosyltransferase|nr:nucleoside 2-deoxyribosyltransferase [Rhodospirillaceae bacterium]MBT3885854.1 nucleoside 2-deoxyribosyltransferase [Rhodospirillaceae bacterium]MBT4117970.1 nucleoside 2-deoxyribosyltransferase [Rhodospirillaceae bacterium]MBT4673987.1 nucleoside 2-deoxyribosyltransferase [Rhodospirillaceae bacterium]MBT4721985.1 nucleoside 2-deoxyribosyltransferase [Rhodospirillaceae bacterium]